MAGRFSPLSKLLGKPDFQPESRIESQAEKVILQHLKNRDRGNTPFPITIDDLTTLIETAVDDLDLYSDLSQYGPGVEGLTIFRPGSKPQVRIAAELSETANTNRLKSTLAHEFGHVFLHNPMFQRHHQAALIQIEHPSVQLTFRDEEASASQSDLFEFQAWYFCRALLMPASELNRLIRTHAEAENHYGEIWHAGSLGQKVIGLTAKLFGVSEAIARIHLLRSKRLCESKPGPTLF